MRPQRRVSLRCTWRRVKSTWVLRLFCSTLVETFRKTTKNRMGSMRMGGRIRLHTWRSHQSYSREWIKLPPRDGCRLGQPGWRLDVGMESAARLGHLESHKPSLTRAQTWIRLPQKKKATDVLCKRLAIGHEYLSKIQSDSYSRRARTRML